MASPTSKRPLKPTVFLSHSSTNRRELLALKRFLDQRAGGLIEFFLSSDDDSIAHGTIWPAEVRAALDRMVLMLIFVSPDALKSGWTYFEAGYGLHKTGTANIYCLPGADKAALPSPFNIVQNRNLHSARDLGLLINQINTVLGARMKETVSKEEFDALFRKPRLGLVQAGPSFEELVDSVAVSALGSADSIEVFTRACRASGEPVSTVAENDRDRTTTKDERYSTGVRIAVAIPELNEMDEEVTITAEMRKDGAGKVDVWGDRWTNPSSWVDRAETKALAEIEDYNARVRELNEKTRRENEKASAEPRECEFLLSPINFPVPVGIVDRWLAEVGIKRRLVIEVQLRSEVTCETKLETVSAKIHGSELVLRDDGTLLWPQKIAVMLPSRLNRGLVLSALEGSTNLTAFRIPELVSTLFDLSIL